MSGLVPVRGGSEPIGSSTIMQPDTDCLTSLAALLNIADVPEIGMDVL